VLLGGPAGQSSASSVSVQYATANGTASAGTDYSAVSGTLNFAPGQTVKNVVVPITDVGPKPNRSFTLNLTNPTNATTADATGVVTIGASSAAPVTLPAISAPPDLVVGEGDGYLDLTVRLSAPGSNTVSVNYATQDQSAGSNFSCFGDYLGASGTLTFAPGETSKTVAVLVKGDRLGEPNETFFVNLSAATNAAILGGQAVGTIRDDEPRISITDVSKLEGKKGQTTLLTFTIMLSAPYDKPVTMSFTTTNRTAKSGNDYTAKTGTLTFAPGRTTKTITITVNGDGKKEAAEVFYLDLFGKSSNSLFTTSRGIGTILNDD
jgi:hypothetical protein